MFISEFSDRFNVWKMRYSPIKLDKIRQYYLALNFLITVVGFSIYKSYYISEQKTKYIDVYKIFANEYIKRINENKTLQKCTCLMKVKNNIINAK